MNRYINAAIALSITLSLAAPQAHAQHKKFMIKKGGSGAASESSTTTSTTTTSATTSTTKSATAKPADTDALPPPPKPKEKKPIKSVLGPTAIITPSGLQYKDVKVGTGASPQKGQVIWVHYTGWTQPDGKKFDSSVDRGVPFNFIIGYQQAIQGWDEGVSTMKVGGKRIFIVPPDLGYGAKGTNTVPPDTTLKYEITLLSIGPKMPKIDIPKPDAQKTALPGDESAIVPKPKGKPQ